MTRVEEGARRFGTVRPLLRGLRTAPGQRLLRATRREVGA